MTSTTLSAGGDRTGLLRKVLLADATFSGATGVILFAAATYLAEQFGLPGLLLRLVGLSLLPFSAGLLYLASRVSAGLTVVRIVIGSNLLWVAASVALLFSGWVDPSGAGTAFIIAQAIIVAGFAELQYLGLRRAI